MAKAKVPGCRIVLPEDVTVAKIRGACARAFRDADHVGADDMILDVGPKAVAHIESLLAKTKTLVWNGPFGAFELPPFDEGTNAVAQTAARLPAKASCFRSRAAATPCRRSTRPAPRPISLMSRRRAAPSSNGWKARRFRRRGARGVIARTIGVRGGAIGRRAEFNFVDERKNRGNRATRGLGLARLAFP